MSKGISKCTGLLASTGKKAFLFLLFPSFLIHVVGLAQPRSSVKKSQPKRSSTAVHSPSRKKTSAKPSKAPPKQAAPQSLSDIRSLLERERITLAKNAIEAYFGQPKLPKTAEAWYVKGKVYSALSAHPKTHKLHPEARMTALEAFRKSLETNKSQSFLQFTMDNFKPVFTLYTDGLQKGVDYYNTGMFEAALTSFREASMAGEFIYEQGWGLSKLDTTLTFYAGLASYKLGNTEDCAQYFKKLADGSVAVNEGYAAVYRFLARYAYDRKNEAALQRYIQLGGTLFPGDKYFSLLDLDWSRDRRDFITLFDKYERMLARSPASYDLTMDYANDLFGFLSDPGLEKSLNEYEERSRRAESLYQQLIKSNAESVDTWMALGKLYYNQLIRLEQELSQSKIKSSNLQRAEVKGSPQSIKLADNAIDALQHVILLLDGFQPKKQEADVMYQSACSLMSFCYEYKKDTERAELYRKMHATKNHPGKH